MNPQPARLRSERTLDPTPALNDTLRFGDCELHLPTRQLWRQGRLQHVRRRVFDLIAFLIARRPASVSHREIALAVWTRSDVRQTVIAQAVLQARRLTGDDLETPRYFVTVRGVGYRFAGQLKLGVAAETPQEERSGPGLAELRAAVEDARTAAERSDHDAALFLGERAIEMAERAGANALKAMAMASTSWAALHKGTMALASRYAFEAMRLAEAEDHRAAAADARVRVAYVLYAGGDLSGALQMLAKVRIPEDIGPDDPAALRCATLSITICGDLQRFEEARAWCERARQISLQRQASKRAIRERITAVNLHIKEAEAAEALGQTDRQQDCLREALALNEQLWVDIAEVGDEIERMCWYGNQGVVLTGLGRIAEAWPCAEQARRLLESWPNRTSPWFLTHQSELRLQWATMLHRVSRNTEALEQIEPAAVCAESEGRHGQAIRLAMLAAKVCESSRQFEAALQWMRRAQVAQQRLQLENASRLATAYQAGRDHDQLCDELRTTREQLTAAKAQIQQLTERVQSLERCGAAGGDGLLPVAAFELALQQRFNEAQARALPLPVCLMRVEPRQYAATWDSSDARQAVLRLASAVIRTQLGALSTLVCAWSEDTLVFTVEGHGARRAITLCEDLESRLAECTSQGAAALGAWSFRSKVVDLGRHEDMHTALQTLRRTHVAEPQRQFRLA